MWLLNLNISKKSLSKAYIHFLFSYDFLKDTVPDQQKHNVAPGPACCTVKIFPSFHCSTHRKGAYGKRANGGRKDTACPLNTLTAHRHLS